MKNLITQNIDLHALALCNAMMLEVYQATSCHLYRSENGDNFEDSIVKTLNVVEKSI